MGKTGTRLLLVAWVCLFLAGCGDDDSRYVDLFLTGDDHGRNVEIGLDNAIVIELASNPSTGYHWVHTNADGSFLFLAGEPVFSLDPACMGLDGCGGVERLTFKAGHTGHGLVNLEYVRDFEGEPAGYFQVSVDVY